ncbi:MAG: cbb3-type cytochrome c oxidase subunit 3 [Paracoccaceae bacterium]
MDRYSILRHFADSWGLVAMLLFFLGVVLYAFRPGSRAIHADTSQIPLRHDDVLEDDPANVKRTTRQPAMEARK